MLPQFKIFHIIILILISPPLAYAQQEEDGIIAQQDCNSTCGTVSIPFPFGMNEPHCYAHKWFEIECKVDNISRGPTPYLKSLKLEVNNFYSGMVEIMNPIYRSNCQKNKSSNKRNKTVINLRDSPFVYSQNENTFLAVGCNKLAFLQSKGTTVGGCVSICDEKINSFSNFYSESDSCNGEYCCWTSLPLHLSEYNTTFRGLSEQSSDDCSYALIVRKDWVSLSRSYSSDYYASYKKYAYWMEKLNELQYMEYAPAVLEWEILNDMLINSTFQLPSKFCHDKTILTVAIPTLLEAAQKFQNSTITQNNRWKKWVIVGISLSLGSIGFLIGLWFFYKDVKKRIIKKRRQKFFKRNGGLLLQKRMSSGEVNVDRTALFTLKDLKKATENFNKNRVLGKGGQGTVYKGMLVDGKIVAVKKFKVEGKVEEFINEFVILSQINNRNVVELLGCCLETEIPLLVYEFIPNGNLFEYLHDQNEDIPMTWDIRLRIATEIAGALFYLHSTACQPIYHRDIKSTNIILDEKYRAKLADFGASRIISIEATHLTTMVQGTFGYLDPEYFHTSQFTEKSDVYSFGVVLAELLTRKKPISSIGSGEYQNLASYFVQCIEENILFDIVDERVTKEGEKEHVIAVANLAYRCLELNGRKRPTIGE
ncbi:Wall-associated kinase family protein [Trifolium repens]|nr:Wall-associated kinase family protein [Trifolium repens]